MVVAPLPPRILLSPDHALTAASTTSSWSTAGTLQSGLALMVATPPSLILRSGVSRVSKDEATEPNYASNAFR